MRPAFITQHRHIWPINWRCQVLEVSRSGFHAGLSRPPGTRDIHDAKLVTAIQTNFKAGDPSYGARRVWRDVLEDGLKCILYQIERLLRINSLRARHRRRREQKTMENGWPPQIETCTGTFSLINRTMSGSPKIGMKNIKKNPDFSAGDQ
jgi:hypothetical protein